MTMQTTITVHHVDLTPAERLWLSEINKRMQHYFRSLISLRWDIRESARFYATSCNVHAGSGYFRAQASANRVGAAMDLAFDKVVRQRRRARVKAVTARTRAKVSRAGRQFME